MGVCERSNMREGKSSGQSVCQPGDQLRMWCLACWCFVRVGSLLALARPTLSRD